MLPDSLQDIDEIGIGIDTLLAACDQQAVHDGQVLGAYFRPAKEVIFSAHGDRPQGPFQMVRVHLDLRFTQKDFQRWLPIHGVLQRLAQRIAGRQVQALTLLIAALPESFDHRPAVGLPRLVFVLTPWIASRPTLALNSGL
jgi:hypothetical protein